MKKWRCTVCGYVHEGNEPPEKCPVCGADKSLFEEVEEKSEAKEEIEAKTPEKEEKPELEQKKELDKIEVPDSDAPAADASASKLVRIYNFIVTQLLKHHAHPISVHFPNGVLPMSVIFIFLAVAFDTQESKVQEFKTVGFYSLTFVVFTLPFVLFTGFLEWKRKYGGHLTKIFLTKIICAFIVTGTAVCAVVWRFVDPKVMDIYSPDRWTYVLLCLTMLGAAIVAGMIGGKLVFKD